MTQTFDIQGMTCNGCRTGVENKLNAIPGVNATVSLEDKTAILETARHLTAAELEAVLPEKYTVTAAPKPNQTNTRAPAEAVSELRQLFPLFLIFAYLTIGSVAMNVNPWNGSEFMLDFMGLFYIIFSFFKLLDLKGFPDSFRMYDPLAKAVPAYGWIYPFIELALGILFLTRWQIPVALVATIVILGVTTVGVVRSLLNKDQIQCACLGTALKLPMTKATFIENSIMLVMAVVMLVS